MCDHDWQYSDFALHKICATCGAVMRYDQEERAKDNDAVGRTYRIADLPDPMGVNQRPKIWGSS